MAVSDILQGNPPKESEIPPIVSEFFMAMHFGWTLPYIRSMDWKDADAMTTFIGVMYRLQSAGKDAASRSIAAAMSKSM